MICPLTRFPSVLMIRQMNTHQQGASNVYMKDILKMAKKVADSPAPVLITGETGTGKELVSDYIHNNSVRRHKPLVKINCAAIPNDLVESELFGSTKGAFTGAYDRCGIINSSQEGTFVLDELGELPTYCQAKLLRFLQTGEYRMVGEYQIRYNKSRMIASTNVNIDEAMDEKTLRRDLIQRLDVIRIDIPPLRFRKDEIPELVEKFLRKYNSIENKNVKINKEVFKYLNTYDWPGNVRELENLIRRGIIMTDGDEITIKDLPKKVLEIQKPTGILTIMEQTEKETILNFLRVFKNNKLETAKKLGIGRQTLYNKMEKYGIQTLG